MKEKLVCDQLILGAGVIGLAVAAETGDASTVLVEAHDGFGRETSSRNSEVIHSGIHYPPNSLKTHHCIEGLQALYSFAERYRIPYKQCGKLVVAFSPEETAHLDRIEMHAKSLDVPCERLSRANAREKESHLDVQGALFFPKTGIIDSHKFMAALETKAVEQGVVMAYRHRVTGIGYASRVWHITVESSDGEMQIETPVVVNAAGLSAAFLSNVALNTRKYAHRFCRGRYFQMAAKYRSHFQHLVYPVPQVHGLGVHTTSDLEGYLKLGPDVDWCPDSDPALLAKYYTCDWEALRPAFAEAGRKLVPQLTEEDLTPGTIGIRPKLFIDDKPHPDFLVETHKGWTHFLGIESPGLTSALSLARFLKSE